MVTEWERARVWVVSDADGDMQSSIKIKGKQMKNKRNLFNQFQFNSTNFSLYFHGLTNDRWKIIGIIIIVMIKKIGKQIQKIK